MRRLGQGDPDARDRLVLANLGLVFVVAREYRGSGVPFADLVQEGMIGLLQAALGFDHRREVRFSTYAVWRICGRVLAAIATSSLIRLPARVDREQRPVFISLDASSTDGGVVASDLLVDERISDPIDCLIEEEDRSNLGRWLTLLPARHREVIERRYGLAGRPAQSHRQIACRLGLGEDRCREIEREALRRLRIVAGDRTSRHRCA